jgi:hypothetical protein
MKDENNNNEEKKVGKKKKVKINFNKKIIKSPFNKYLQLFFLEKHLNYKNNYKIKK